MNISKDEGTNFKTKYGIKYNQRPIFFVQIWIFLLNANQILYWFFDDINHISIIYLVCIIMNDKKNSDLLKYNYGNKYSMIFVNLSLICSKKINLTISNKFYYNIWGKNQIT